MRAFLARGAAIAVAMVLVAATPASSLTTRARSATEPEPLMRWKLALDLRTHPNLNPFPSYLGGDPVWSLRESQSLQRNGDYGLLPSYSPTFGADGLKAWHGTAANCVKVPAIGANTIDKPAPLCAGQVPGDAAFVIPAPTRAPVVGWTSPFAGTVTISHDAIAEVGGFCGAGVSYYVDLGTTQLTATRLTNNGGTDLPSITLTVREGQTLYFIVEPNSAANVSCDITQLQVTIDRGET